MPSLRSLTDALIFWGVFFLLLGLAATVKGEEPTVARLTFGIPAAERYKAIDPEARYYLRGDRVPNTVENQVEVKEVRQAFQMARANVFAVSF
jgi:hypothetical protein